MLQDLESREILSSIGKLVVNRFSSSVLSNSNNKLKQNIDLDEFNIELESISIKYFINTFSKCYSK